MKFLNRRRIASIGDVAEDNPLDMIANLFDVATVLAVGLMFALVSSYRLMDLLSPDTEVTITKQDSKGNLEVIVKKGKEVKIQKVTDKSLQGQGIRLGVAYKLADGRVIYVPEGGPGVK